VKTTPTTWDSNLLLVRGYDLTGAIKLFQDLQWYQEKSGISNASAFLANHPLNSSRIKNVEELEPIIESQIEELGN